VNDDQEPEPEESAEDFLQDYNLVAPTEHTGFPCKECGRNLISEGRLSRHMQVAHAAPNFACKHCGGKFAQMYTRNTHSVKCPRRIMKFSENETLALEPELQPKPRKLQCTKCQSEFVTKKKLINHIHRVHPQPKRFTCKNCGKGFGRPNYYKSHVALCNRLRDNIKGTDTEHNKFECSECRAILATPRRFFTHMEREHSVKNVICRECGAGFRSRSTSYKKHRTLCKRVSRAAKSELGGSHIPVEHKPTVQNPQKFRFKAPRSTTTEAEEPKPTVEKTKKSKSPEVIILEEPDFEPLIPKRRKSKSPDELPIPEYSIVQRSDSSGSDVLPANGIAVESVDSIPSTSSGETGTKILPCAECSAVFQSPTLLKYHLRGHKNKKMFCLLCNGGFSTIHYFRVHRKICGGGIDPTESEGNESDFETTQPFEEDEMNTLHPTNQMSSTASTSRVRLRMKKLFYDEKTEMMES